MEEVEGSHLLWRMASFTLTARTTWRCSSKLCSIFTKDWKDDAESHQNPRPVKTPLNITLPEVAKLLSKAIITGASGSDNIPNQLLEELSTEKTLLLLICSIKHSHSFWRLMPTPAPSISLTWVCSKLLERIVVNHLLARSHRLAHVWPCSCPLPLT